MSRQSRLDWFASRASSRSFRRGGSLPRAPHRRPLRFEPLEDRRLLAITVTTLVDENDGVGVGGISLREAIAAAVPGDTIDFAVTGAIMLQHGELVIDKDLTIDGPGAELLTVQVQNLGRAFLVDDGDGESVADVAVRGLTITQGFEPNGGGAIFSRERLEVADCLITGNTAQWGGGIYNDVAGELTVVNSEISGNTATSTGGGGGIYNWGGLAFVFDSVISGNNSGTTGGGLLNANNGSLTIARTTVADNDAVTLGGGLFNGDGNVLVVDSTFSGNTADYGGGIYVITPTNDATTISNSTISNNIAPLGGAGVFTNSGHTIIQFSTVTENNSNDFAGSGVVTWGDSSFALTEIFSSIVAGNHHTDVALSGGFVDTFESQGYNLIGTGSTTAFSDPGDLVIGTDDPGLGPLADYGGPTKTHALLDGSIAIDAGEEAFTPPPDGDQRGAPFARVSGGRMDIGAFEAEASYFVVDTLLDEDDGIGEGVGTSLRDALTAASFIDVNAVVITFEPALTESGPGTMLLTYGELNVVANVTIAGPGANRLTIDAQGDSRVMLVDDFDGESLREVTIRGLTLTGGVDVGEGEGGGGIFNNERLTLRESVLTGNEARWGGGIYNHTDGELTVVRSKLSGNSAMFGGAGLYNWGGDVEIRETTVSGNDAADAGGVLNANFGEMLIETSTISGNHATGGSGGGILQAGGLLTIHNSTVSGNKADNEGGGIQHAFGPLEIFHSTITANRADADQSGVGFGGGIFHVLGPTLLVDHTIVAGNFRHASTRDDVAGSFDARFSLIGDATGASINDLEGSLIGDNESPIDPLLGDLEDNGGPTHTHALLTDSPAIDAGDLEFNPPPVVDQRGVGFERESGGQIDIGAFEVQQLALAPALPGDYNRDNVVDAADYTIWRNTLGQDVAHPYDGADGDGDGKVDADDHRVWKIHFGESIEEGGIGALSGSLAGSVATDGQIIVTTLADTIDFSDGVTSLREAIFAANIVSGPNTIVFDEVLTAEQPGTILLTLGELKITDSLTITGPGAARLTIDASGNDAKPDVFGDGSRIFNVDDGSSQSVIDVSILGLTLTGGDVQSGGAILARERLTAQGLVILENQATMGGAIALFAPSGNSLISDCTIVENVAASQGGAFLVQGGSSSLVTIRDNTISRNMANRGGALYAGQAPPKSSIILTGNLIADNNALQQGGAICLSSISAPKTTIRNSTLSGNTAGQQGGALFVNGVRELTIVDSQIIDNKSLAASPSLGRGGAIYASQSDLNIIGSTISGNTAASGGGTHSRNGELIVNFSVLANNTATAGDGGGIYSNMDRLSISGSTISGNTATGVSSQLGRGGGLWHATGPLTPTTILDTSFVGNSATNSGGGAEFRSATVRGGSAVSLINTSFSANSSTRGGGIALGDQGRFTGAVTIDGGSIVENAASASGGGLYGSANSMTIRGTTIAGNHANANGGGFATSTSSIESMNLTIINATIAHNSAGSGTPQGSLGFGGGIYVPVSTAFVTLLGTDVSQNSARLGGGIALGGPQIVTGTLAMVDSTISGNTSLMHGGGIYILGGALSFTRSKIVGNSAGTASSGPPANGGGIFSRSADITVVESSLTGNVANTGRGGAIYMFSGGDLSLTSSTVAGNIARQDGGGIWSGLQLIDRALIQNSTISGNSSTQGTGGVYLRGVASIRHSTITKNIGGGTRPGGLLAGDGSQQIEFDHTIVAGNAHSSGGPSDVRWFVNEANATLRFSLIGDNSSTTLAEAPLGAPDANGNLIGKPLSAGGSGVIDPLLGPLLVNGGPTMTHAILPGSPALDGGVLVTGVPLGFDQRGNPFSRMVDGTGDGHIRIDMGAYESQGVPSFSLGDYTRDGIVDACDYLLWRNTLGSEVVPFSGADGDGDGLVAAADYQIWKSHFGDRLTFTSGGGAAAAFAVFAKESSALMEPALPPLLSLDRNVSAAGVVTSSSLAVAATDLANDALVAWLVDNSRAHLGIDKDWENPVSAGDQTASDATDPVFDAVFALLGE